MLCPTAAEGRIEPSDGTLMCSYHGWRFNGEGRCTDIPQSVDAKANATACASPRSCAIARPIKVLYWKGGNCQTLMAGYACRACTCKYFNFWPANARRLSQADSYVLITP